MDVSYSEKGAWISLVSTVLIFGYYALALSGLSGLPEEEGNKAAFSLLGRVLVLSIIVESVFHGMLAATNHKAAEAGEDEREQLISLKASRVGYYVLTVGVMFTLGRLFFMEAWPEWFVDRQEELPMLSAHILMFAFIVSEVVRFGGQIFYHRRGV